MFDFLFRSHRAKPLVEKTSLSKFVREASSGEKKQIYRRVILEATAEQKEVLRAVEAKKARERQQPA